MADNVKRISHRSLLPLVVILLSLVYLLIGINQGLFVYDEGLYLYGAMRVLDGELPYRDFWTILLPGQFYTLAALFDLFGQAIIVARISFAIVVFSLLTTVYLIAWKLRSENYAWIG